MPESSVRNERVASLSRACENCRVRKSRCNRSFPCSSCQILGMQCQPTSVITEQRPRIAISNHYEKQIEKIQERLGAIEKDLKVIAYRSLDHDDIQSSATSTNQETPSNFTSFEGDSSFNREKLQASRAASSILSTNQDPAVKSALSSLHANLTTIDSSLQQDYAHHHDIGVQQKTSLLPVALVIAVIKKAKVNPPLCAVSSSWTDYIGIEQLCQKVYFPLEQPSVGALALMHGVLFRIFQELSQQNDPVFAGYDLEDCAKVCDVNFHHCLRSYESFFVPTLENVQTLSLAAYRAQEESQLSLCRMYVSTARTICQTLGYHRESSYRNDTPEVAQSKRHAFYSLYTIDKNLSLVLGHSSNFNDNDIDAEPFAISTNPMQSPWDVYTHICYRFAKIQGDIYNDLYSASATKHSQQKRLYFVDELSTRISDLREELQSLNPCGAYYSELLQTTKEHADFIVYAVLSVVYRAETRFTNAAEISSRCYYASRKSLESHLHYSAGLKDCSMYQQMGYVQNTLLFPSFTPYLVVFTHAIATNNDGDFKLLEDTVESLARLRDVAPGSRRLYHMCKSFLDLAEVLVRSQEGSDRLGQNENSPSVCENSATTDPTRQMTGHGVNDAWDGFRISGSTAASSSIAVSNAGNVGLEAFDHWTNWLGSDVPLTEALQFEMTCPDLRDMFSDDSHGAHGILDGMLEQPSNGFLR